MYGSNRVIPHTRLNANMNTLLSDLVGWSPLVANRMAFSALVSSHEAFVEVRAELPGVRLENINIKTVDDQLLLEVSQGAANDSAGTGRAFQATRTFQFDHDVLDATQITAYLDAGILTVRIPRKAKRIHTVTVTAGPAPEPKAEVQDLQAGAAE